MASTYEATLNAERIMDTLDVNMIGGRISRTTLQIADITGLHKQTVTRHLRALEAAGFVRLLFKGTGSYSNRWTLDRRPS